MVVILAVLGILFSLSFDSLTRLREGTSKAKAIAHLRTIAMAYRQYMDDKGHPIRWKELDEVRPGAGGYDVTLIAAVLAKEGYLGAVDAWSWDFDYRVKRYLSSGKPMPLKICNITRNGSGNITSVKVDTNFWGQSGNGFPVSVCAMVAGDGMTNDDFLANPGEVPLAFSRGLRSKTAPGTWIDSKINFDLGGIFGEKGGFIVFFDGHVEWFENLGTGALRKYGTGARTNKIYEAILSGGITGSSIPDHAYFLSWRGGAPECDYF
jgi:hypothetical protein